MKDDLIHLNPSKNTHNLSLLLLFIPIIVFILVLAFASSRLMKKNVAGFSDSNVLGTESQKVDK